MGRPREFCIDTALERALEVFWRHGFEGASMMELTAAMGITKPSLYASYGNKADLFRKALDLYDYRHMGFMRDALGAETSRKVVAQILFGMVRATAADGEHPPGCMSVNGALACSVAADPIRAETMRRRQVFEGELVQRLRRACDDGDLPADSDPATLAGFVMAVSAGIACQAASGVTSASLRATADLALKSWPAGTPARPPIATQKLSA